MEAPLGRVLNPMKRAVLSLGFVMVCSCFAGAQETPPTPPPAGKPPITVELDGRLVSFPNAKPKAYVGRVLVPLRGIFEQIGAYVEYDQVTHVIKARMGNEEIELKVGNPIAKKNGAEILLDISPVVDQGTTMVPLRFLAEALGAVVQYDRISNKITITTTSPREEPF